ncbi:MAG: hypothetical protein KatS3mg131_3994 [Candidatus Tectimicrobiota bacterium]|nr:MAG: hypothetical protein KatS3mg131_3994 [Candidatus Tectomicrobia bacterium]
MDMQPLCDDLAAEQQALAGLLAGLDEAAWARPTPAEGWQVRDQISHLGWTDRVAILAVTDPARFTAEMATQARAARLAQQLEVGRRLRGAELLAWWQHGFADLLAVLRRLDARTRIPWFGPAMSAASFATARLMEIWAHGQDIVDALGLVRPASERLRHIAHLGVLARPYSYRVRGLEPPEEPVHVVLTSPAGARWSWGPEAAAQRITGPALDFCLVVTQRRHLADTALQVQGELARQWMHLAQAFAGPPGPGRRPGQFPRSG